MLSECRQRLMEKDREWSWLVSDPNPTAPKLWHGTPSHVPPLDSSRETRRACRDSSCSPARIELRFHTGGKRPLGQCWLGQDDSGGFLTCGPGCCILAEINPARASETFDALYPLDLEVSLTDGNA